MTAPRPLMRLFFVCGIFLSLLVLAESVARIHFAVLSWRTDLLLHPENIWYHYYPELEALKNAPLEPPAGTTRVLLLGGSVIHGARGRGSMIEPLLNQALREQGKLPLIVNLGQGGHSSRDAWIKYRFVSSLRFDSVFYYEAINEARANNSPPKFFDAQYNHFDWYSEVNTLLHHSELKYMAFPFFAEISIRRILRATTGHDFLTLYHAKQQWLEYGSEIKSIAGFEKNLSAIIELSQKKKEKLILGTYAYYIPEDYSEERWNEHTLDYSPPVSPKCCAIEVWGKPKNVEKAILAHNEILRRLSTSKPLVSAPDLIKLVEIEKAIPKQGRFFRDICHLTEDGSRLLVNAILSSF